MTPYDGQERRADNAQMAASVEYIRGVLDTHVRRAEAHFEKHEGLPERVQSLEGSRKTNFWVTYVAAPILAVAHGVAAHFGIKL